MNRAAFPVFIGYDELERDAYEVARYSLLCNSTIPVAVFPVKLDQCTLARMLPAERFERRDGVLYDKVSRAPCSTEFAVSRFCVPIMCPTEPFLFVDCDVVFTGDIAEMVAEFDARYAVQVVQHPPYTPTPEKMDGFTNPPYRRKNWSSVMLCNPSHPAWVPLKCGVARGATGRYLHGFEWLMDSEIGRLHPRWNWLVDEQPYPGLPGIAHYTLGGPWCAGWTPRASDELWALWAHNAGAIGRPSGS